MRKDIEWLKEEIDKLEEWTIDAERYADQALEDVRDLIDQLDEPEVLSWEWIEENSALGQFATSEVINFDKFVKADKLQNLLVPKQELPVIPKFVVDWIEDNKQFEEKWNDYSKEDAMSDTIHFTIYGLFADYPATNSHVELRKPVLKWLSDDRGNYFKLVNSVRYGYEVEKEQKYYVINNDQRVMLARMMDGKTITEADPFKLEDMYEVEKKAHRLTEKEIKDYDERYIPFMVPVDEVNND